MLQVDRKDRLSNSGQNKMQETLIKLLINTRVSRLWQVHCCYLMDYKANFLALVITVFVLTSEAYYCSNPVN